MERTHGLFGGDQIKNWSRGNLNMDHIFSGAGNSLELEQAAGEKHKALENIDDQAYMQVEKCVQAELEAFKFWHQEVEDQRVSSVTIDKSMIKVYDTYEQGVYHMVF